LAEELSDNEIENLVRYLIDSHVAEPTRTVVEAWLAKRCAAALALIELGINLE
jgi:hypothetical protein